MKALLYCTKGKPNLYRPFEYDCFEQDETSGFYLANNPMLKEDTILNGKIVAEVEIDKVDRIWYMPYEEDNRYDCLFLPEEELCLKSCLDHYELYDYLKGNNGYALHLTNLKVFDEPKELSEYYLFDPDYCILKEIKKAPQNMCRVVERHRLIEYPIKEYVLISIQPQHLCNILNGIKTIEVRKKILNCLKKGLDKYEK